MFESRTQSKFEALSTLGRRVKDIDLDAVRTCLDLLQAAFDVRQSLNERFFRKAVSEGRFTVLALLLAAPDWNMTPSELAAGAGVTRATMTGLLDGLEADRHVERKGFKNDRRKTTVHLTREGRDFLLDLLPGYFKVMASATAHLSETQRRTLSHVLEKVRGGVG